MRDLVLTEALQTMAGDCALRLRELLAAGEEVPYEVHDGADGSPLVQYTPQTPRFIRDHTAILAGLDSFGTACAALESTGLTAPYLEGMGVAVPPDERARAEIAGIVFLCRLWQGSTDFSLDDLRLQAAIEELLALSEVSEHEIEIAVPLRGFQMPVSKLELTGATIVRADTVEVPSEARAAEGMGSAAWEPTFLAVTRVDATIDQAEGADAGARAVEAFRRLITTLRLFKQGGVALGPHAWTRIGGDRWRRIATGSGRPRPGGYRLADAELGELATLSRGLNSPSTPFARMGSGRDGFPAVLARAISRFEAGVERHAVLEALNDFLLSLRFLLEGGGPAELSISMRVAALCAEPDDRDGVRATVERAIALERELWSGEPGPGAANETRAELVFEVESLARAILADAACGHLGADLRVTADEILLADGLAAGEGAQRDRGETAEWNVAGAEIEIGDVALGDELRRLEDEVSHPAELVEADAAEPEVEPDARDAAEAVEVPDAASLEHGLPARAENKIFELAAVPEPEPEDPSGAGTDDTPEGAAEKRFDPRPIAEHAARLPEIDQEEIEWVEPQLERDPAAPRRPRLEPVRSDGPVARLIADSDVHRREVADRVGFLFPVPEETEWGVREIGYDRRRRAGAPQAG